MSQENVEIAKRLYVATASLLEKASAGGDISDAPEYWELFDPDVVIVEIAEFPDAATYRGPEQMRRWLQGLARRLRQDFPRAAGIRPGWRPCLGCHPPAVPLEGGDRRGTGHHAGASISWRQGDPRNRLPRQLERAQSRGA